MNFKLARNLSVLHKCSLFNFSCSIAKRAYLLPHSFSFCTHCIQFPVDKSEKNMAAATNSNNDNSNTTSNQESHRRTSLKRSLTKLDDEMEQPAKFFKASYHTPVLKVKKLSEHAKLPVKGSLYAAGYDLHSAYDIEIPAHGKALVKTDIAVGIPIGCYGRIAPRSGLAWKNHIDIGAGVVDSDYRGNVGVVMFNHSDSIFKVTKHMRVAQLILERYEHKAVLMECDDLDDTVRGEGGFGSTGVMNLNMMAMTTTTTTSTNDDNDGENNSHGMKMNMKMKTSDGDNEKKETEMENENTGDATNVVA